MQFNSPHTFHIPVMGISFTIDSPVKVAPFGINSVISIIEDNLIEVMRKHYYQENGEVYIPINKNEEDYRARRITDYLDLINRIVKKRTAEIKASNFIPGSEIMKYFKMLPEGNSLKELFQKMINEPREQERLSLQRLLREKLVPGAIEVNIMTKIDNDSKDKNGVPIENGSDAVAALRGYAKSTLTNSAVVFSAGINPRLFNYLENFYAFDAKNWGQFDKKIILKVSDYRSALIQGKLLAKKGIWVSEYRIESGLNCGGHAFATEGYLLGPILQEFKTKRQELVMNVHKIYREVLESKNKPVYDDPHPIKITVQGGIGTNKEDEFLHNYYKVDSTGWGTPFLLCPEATTVDDETLKLLVKAEEDQVVLSKSSPLGVRFHYLKGTSAEKERIDRVKKGNPGSPCTEKYLKFNTEFTDNPICTASKKYQKLKLTQLQSLELSENEYQRQAEEVLSKECLCIGLSNSAADKYQQPFVKKLHAVTICPGPNVAYFSKVVSLEEMVGHIYGRNDILRRSDRPHMFIKELQLYVDYIVEKVNENHLPNKKEVRSYTNFCNNLLEGINYYRELVKHNDISQTPQIIFKQALDYEEQQVKELVTRIDSYSGKEIQNAEN